MWNKITHIIGSPYVALPLGTYATLTSTHPVRKTIIAALTLTGALLWVVDIYRNHTQTTNTQED